MHICPAWLRWTLFGVTALWLSMTGAALAQAADDGAAATVSNVSESQAIDALIRALEDPAARTRLVEALRAEGTRAEGTRDEGHTPAAGAEMQQPVDATDTIPKAETAAPSELGFVLSEVRSSLIALAEFAVDAIDIDRLAGWVDIQLSSAQTRGYWGDFLLALGLSLGLAAAAYWAARIGMEPSRKRLRDRSVASSARGRLRGGIKLAGFELLPIVAFGAVGAAVTATQYFPLRTELVATAILITIGGALLSVAAFRVLLRPNTTELRPVKLSDESAYDLFQRARHMTLWIMIGQAVFGNINDLRVPPGVFEGLERLWGLVALGMVLAAIFRYRTAVSAAIRGSGKRFNLPRRFIAQIWYVIAVLYAVSAYLVWALEVYQGFELLVRGGLLSVLVLIALPPLGYLVRNWLENAETAEATGPAAVLQQRYQRYASLAQLLVSAGLYAAAGLAIAYAWGLEPLDWLQHHLSGDLAAALGNVLFFGIICWAIWEAFDLWMALHLQATDKTGTPVERSARSRTLLPLLRTLVAVSLVVTFLAGVLTSIGLDVAPLLATAGVVGIAIGFGAQKLVQDVINGLFILFQNTISVGDIVELAGHSGTVERITVRTLELRDLEGALHTIPFSAVSTVKNMTRDFAFAMMDIGVAYKEDADEVIEVLRQLGAEFESDPVQGPNLLSSLEMFGLQELGDSAVTIRCRFKVLPLTQFAIRRAFLGRVKRRFDELGIEIPFPQRTIHWANTPQTEEPARPTPPATPADGDTKPADVSQ